MPLNVRLFKALEHRFGKGQVRVVRAGQPMVPEYVKEEGEDGELKLYVRRKVTGEEYQVKCPRCRDYKPRLSISHRWGVRDAKTGTRCLHLIQCWNGDCFRDYDVIRKFYDAVLGSQANTDYQLPEIEERGLFVRRTPEMPGKLWRLDKLAEKVPRHAAVRYAQDRLLCVQTLGEQYGVGYCPDPWCSEATNRLIVPVLVGGKLRGWSGRYLGEPTGEGVPKWYHDPGMEKSKLWYNYDAAARHHTKVIVEGCGDVWGIGSCGLGSLGNKMSAEQLELLQKCCAGDDFALVLLYDPVQSEKDHERGKPHHLEVAWETLRSVRRFAGRVVKVYLSRDLDPGEADRGYQYGLIRHCARQQNVTVRLPGELQHAA